MIFYAPRSWQASWTVLPELGPIVADVSATTEPKKSILGQQLTKDEVALDLAKASARRLGQTLNEAAKQAVTPDVFRSWGQADSVRTESRSSPPYSISWNLSPQKRACFTPF